VLHEAVAPSGGGQLKSASSFSGSLDYLQAETVRRSSRV